MDDRREHVAVGALSGGGANFFVVEAGDQPDCAVVFEC